MRRGFCDISDMKFQTVRICPAASDLFESGSLCCSLCVLVAFSVCLFFSYTFQLPLTHPQKCTSNDCLQDFTLQKIRSVDLAEFLATFTELKTIINNQLND